MWLGPCLDGFQFQIKIKIKMAHPCTCPNCRHTIHEYIRSSDAFLRNFGQMLRNGQLVHIGFSNGRPLYRVI